MIDRPLDFESAQANVCASLLDPEHRDIVLANRVTPEWFDPSFSPLAKSIIETPENWLFGMPYHSKEIMQITECMSSCNFEFWIRELAECRRRNETKKIADIIKQKSDSIEDCGKWMSEMAKVQDECSLSIEHVDYQKEFSDAFFSKKSSLSTGIAQIDSICPWLKGEYIIIAGRPSTGKTCFLVKTLINFINDEKRCLYFALDDPIHYTLDKFNCIGNNIDQNESHGNRSKAESYFNALEEMPLNIAPQKITRLDDIIAYAKNYKINNPDLQVIAVDHLTKIQADGNSAYERTTRVTSELFSLSKSIGVTVVAVSQLNRSSEKEGRRMQMSDLRDSGAIEQDATKILGFYMPEGKLDRDGNCAYQWLVNCDILKNKAGRTGTAFFRFTGCKYSFEEI